MRTFAPESFLNHSNKPLKPKPYVLPRYETKSGRMDGMLPDGPEQRVGTILLLDSRQWKRHLYQSRRSQEATPEIG